MLNRDSRVLEDRKLGGQCTRKKEGLQFKRGAVKRRGNMSTGRGSLAGQEKRLLHGKWGERG